MNEIFTFIFKCLSSVFNFLDFNLPGINLTYIDFFILVMICSLLIRLLKGTLSESGDGVIFGVFESTSDRVEKSRNLSYKEYEKRHERLDNYSRRYQAGHAKSSKEGAKE